MCLGMGGVPFLPCDLLVWAVMADWIMQKKIGPLFGSHYRSPLVGDLKVAPNRSTSRGQERELDHQVCFTERG